MDYNKPVSHSLSCVAIIVSVIAVIVAFSNANEKISTGDTLTVLSTLATVLIGWNILNYMQFKDSMKNTFLFSFILYPKNLLFLLLAALFPLLGRDEGREGQKEGKGQ